MHTFPTQTNDTATQFSFLDEIQHAFVPNRFGFCNMEKKNGNWSKAERCTDFTGPG